MRGTEEYGSSGCIFRTILPLREKSLVENACAGVDIAAGGGSKSWRIFGGGAICGAFVGLRRVFVFVAGFSLPAVD